VGSELPEIRAESLTLISEIGLTCVNIAIQEIVAYGSQEPAEVQLDNDGLMYFKPTCVDTTSSRSYSVRNLSRLPVNFEWRIKHSDSIVLSVHPTFGMIQPNEIQVVLNSVDCLL